MSNFWNFKNNGSGIGELTLYGTIESSTWWGDEITPQTFKRDLDALGDISQLNVYINSDGGDVFAGQAIHSMLKRKQCEVVIYIDGLAASIASVIAMAGDRIIMPKNAMMMIHNAWTIVAGNKEDLRKMAEDLEHIDASIIAAYEEKSGQSEEQIREWMGAEKWFTAEEAVAAGLADEIEESKQLAASLDGGILTLNNERFDLRRFANSAWAEQICTQDEQEPEPAEPEPDNGGVIQPVADNSQERLAQQAELLKVKSKILEV